jgi:hypothetical protein
VSAEHHPIIVEALAKLDAERAELVKLNGHAVVAAEVAQAFADRFTYVRPYVCTGARDVWIEILATDVGDIVAVRRWLATRGYHLRAYNTYEDEGRETHSLAWGETGVGIVLTVHYPRGDSGAACRYVQVGVKEVPVYKLECDGAKGGAK